MASRVHYLANEETCEIERVEEHAAQVPEVRAKWRVNRVMMLMIFCVLLVTGFISLSVYNFIKLNHKEQELEDLRNAVYILTSNNTELQVIRDILQSQNITLNEKHDELTKEFINLQERVDKETSEWKRNNNNLQESLDTLQSQYERNYTEIQKSQDLLKSESGTNYTELHKSQDLLKSESVTNYTELRKIQDLLKSESVTNYTELRKSQDLLKSESVTNYSELRKSQDLLKFESVKNYSDLQESLNILQSQFVTLNEKVDEVCKESNNLKEFYCDATNTSPDNTCSLCKPGGIFFNSKCYFIFTYKLTWKESRVWCMTWGGRLVNIETVEELDFIKSKAQKYYWIGRYNISKENKSTRMGAEPVKSKRASDDYKEECILIDLQNIKVYNHRCGDSHQWICESPAFPLRI